MSTPMNINSVVPNMVDRTPWRWWDLVNVPTGTAIPQQINAFAVPIGAQDPITTKQKSKLDTNMVRGNQFPPPWCIIMRRLQFSFSPNMVLADILQIMEALWIEFKIDQKIFWEGYLQDFPAGSGLAGISTQSGTMLVQNGIPAPQFTMDYGQYAKYIAPTQQFSLQMFFPLTVPTLVGNGTVGWKMRCVIDGLVDRPVQ